MPQVPYECFLLLQDPHFYSKSSEVVSRDDLQTKGWISWKLIEDFDQQSFYNICLPQLKTKRTTRDSWYFTSLLLRYFLSFSKISCEKETNQIRLLIIMLLNLHIFLRSTLKIRKCYITLIDCRHERKMLHLTTLITSPINFLVSFTNGKSN